MYMLSLVFISIYYYTNIRFIGAGSGFTFLFLFLIFVISYQIRNPFLNFFTIKKNLIYVIFFLTYLTLRHALDSQSFSGVISFMFGSTSGVFYSFGLGFLLSYIFCNIYNTIIAAPSARIFLIRLVILYFIVCSFFVIDLFWHYFSVRVSSGFTILEIPTNYQRPGIMIFLFNVQNAILYTIYKTFSVSRGIFISILFYSIALVSAIIAQLIGSNFGFVGVLLLSISVLLFRRLVNISKDNYSEKKISFSSIFFGWIGKEFIFIILLVLTLSSLLLFGLTELSLIDLKSLRIFGDNWEIDSLTERFRLIEMLFIDHFNFAPIFGNMTVHNIMETQYVHSLLALLTHLGITGFALFIILFYLIYSDIKKCAFYDNRLNFEFQLLRLVMITLILFLATLSNFVTWVPLWFMVGLFSVSFINPQAQDVRKIKNNYK
jgi:hypothetical protein